MKTILIAGLLVAATVISGCSTVKGSSVQERRNYVDAMRIDTLQDLYKEHPQSRQQIADAAGYAVFSNINLFGFNSPQLAAYKTVHGVNLYVESC